MLIMIIAGAAVGALAAVLVRYNVKRVGIIREASRLSDEQLETIYRLVEQSGPEPSDAFVLARTNRVASDTEHVIEVPAGVDGFPWSGQRLRVHAGDGVSVTFEPGGGEVSRLGGQIYHVVRVPQSRTKAGRPRRIYSPERYVAASPDLERALRATSPKYPAELLGYLLCPNRLTYEFDPVDQPRIGGSAAWVQNAEFPSCERCNRRLRLIAQVPGGLLGVRHLRTFTLYIFGCADHPEETRIIEQTT